MRVGFLFAVSFFLFLKSLYLFVVQIDMTFKLFAILQKYEFSSKSQLCIYTIIICIVVCDTAKVRVFKQITTTSRMVFNLFALFAILQKYEFSSKSQRGAVRSVSPFCCLRYCKSTSFQANHNDLTFGQECAPVVCDTAKVRVFKQITTSDLFFFIGFSLFAILQKYEFSSKSQRHWPPRKQM